MRIPKINRSIILILIAALVVCGCGKPRPGYKIYRLNDVLIIFLAMQDTSEIVDASVDNDAKELLLDIDTGQQIVNHVMSLKRKLMVPLIKPDETLDIQGTNRINGYGVLHLNVSSPIPRRSSMNVDWTGVKRHGIPKEPGPFKNSGSFRIEDTIFAYSRIPDHVESSWKVSQFGITIEVTDKTTYQNFETDADGNTVLTIESDDPDLSNQSLRFLVEDLQPHETVEVQDKQKLGADVFLVKLKVLPNKNQNKNDAILSDR